MILETMGAGAGLGVMFTPSLAIASGSYSLKEGVTLFLTTEFIGAIMGILIGHISSKILEFMWGIIT